MSQTFTEDSFAAGHAGLTDLQNMEDNFLSLKSMFSGSSAPANSTGFQPWGDTAKKLLKIRNSTNGAWLGILSASTAPRFWVYANAAEDGWIVDSSVTDKVVAIKGGSAAYNNDGGTGQGTWTIAGITGSGSSHKHQWVSAATSYIGSFNASGGTTFFNSTTRSSTEFGAETILLSAYTTNFPVVTFNDSYYTDFSTVTINVTQDGSWRPAAAVGTMQYLDI